MPFPVRPNSLRSLTSKSLPMLGLQTSQPPPSLRERLRTLRAPDYFDIATFRTAVKLC